MAVLNALADTKIRDLNPPVIWRPRLDKNVLRNAIRKGPRSGFLKLSDLLSALDLGEQSRFHASYPDLPIFERQSPLPHVLEGVVCRTSVDTDHPIRDIPLL